MPTGVLVIVVVVPPVVIGADAVIYVAPEESTLAASRVMDATPLAFVKAVAETGVKVTSELAAAKVTTALETNAPLASRSVAVAVTGLPNVTTLEEMIKLREPWLAAIEELAALVIMMALAALKMLAWIIS